MDFESSSVMDDNDDHLVRTIGKGEDRYQVPRRIKRGLRKEFPEKDKLGKKLIRNVLREKLHGEKLHGELKER